MLDDPLDPLVELLELEREDLLAGRLDMAVRRAELKETLLKAAAQVPSETDRLDGVRRLAERNGRLMSAALRGIGAARAQVSQLRQDLAGGLSTYGPDGARRNLGGRRGAVERRA